MRQNFGKKNEIFENKIFDDKIDLTCELIVSHCIRARIVGLRLQDMDSMVGTALTIEREIEDARSTRDASVSSKRKESQSSSSSGKRQRASSSRGFQSRGHLGQG